MEYATLGTTGLEVSVAGLGCGGFSRLGLSAGGSEDEAALLVREAFDMGINFVDTAPIYGTEAIVGKALKCIPRHSVVVATKASVGRNGERQTPARMVESLESSLRLLGTDYIDVFQLHGVPILAYTYARLLHGFCRPRFQDRIGVIADELIDVAHAIATRPIGHRAGARWRRLQAPCEERVAPYAGEIRDGRSALRAARRRPGRRHQCLPPGGRLCGCRKYRE